MRMTRTDEGRLQFRMSAAGLVRAVFLHSIAAFVFACPVAAPAANADPAELVFTNGRIYRGDHQRSWAQALAIKDGRFVAVGTSADVRSHIGADTRVVDLGGRMVMAGIHDLHIHPVQGTLTELYGCKIPAGASLEEIASTVRECAGRQPAGTWVQGGGNWAPLLESGRKPDRLLLDAAAPDNPVFLRSFGGHSGWANSRALELAGIGKGTSDPEGGQIARDPRTREPTGILHESANRLVGNAIPDYSPEQYLEAVALLARELNQLGITAIKDAATSVPVAAAYAGADRAGRLTLRVALSRVWGGGDLAHERQAQWIRNRDWYRSALVNPDFVKIFVDGSAGARKAAYLEPYMADEAHGDAYYGEFLIAPDQLKQDLIFLDRQGLTVKMHCGGDAAARAALDAIEAARQANGDTGLRHEVAHTNLVHPDDIRRFRPLRAIADLSPPYWYPNPILNVLEKTLGRERAGRVWLIRDFVDAGAVSVYGSDWPAVAPNPNPWRALEAMVTRRDPEGRSREPFLPEQAVGLATAVEIFTWNGAEAMRQRDLSGSIENGKYADMIVLDRQLFEIPMDQIGDTRVQLTMLGGKVVHRAPGQFDSILKAEQERWP